MYVLSSILYLCITNCAGRNEQYKAELHQALHFGMSCLQGRPRERGGRTIEQPAPGKRGGEKRKSGGGMEDEVGVVSLYYYSLLYLKKREKRAFTSSSYGGQERRGVVKEMVKLMRIEQIANDD